MQEVNGVPWAFAQIREEMMRPEKRKYKRYYVETDKVQVWITDTRKTYAVNNISRGGVKIEYQHIADGPLELEMVDIIAVNDGRVYLPKIACKTVYDIPTLMRDRSFRGGMMRIRGLKFVALTQAQEDALDILLTQCLNASS